MATEASQAQSTLYIWPDMTLFIGPLQSLGLHAMQTTAINVGLYQPFTLSTEDGLTSSHRCAMIGAGQKHELAANGGIVASLLIERNSSAYHHLPQNNACPARAITPISAAKWVDYLQMIAEVKPTKAVVYNLLKHLLSVDSTAPAMDPRIANAMSAIRLSPESDLSQAQFAAAQGLSQSRFRHLFREQSDIPFRRYRLWRRIISAMEALHNENNITQAAMAAGFSDSAHFNRCFQQAFGLNPSRLFRHMDKVKP
ncbi:MAG: helix-turn-helix transcriptional regulator [Porticoccaceae bacterium]|nr:helix-turn-helix transcriptional regulator [Porticoccaceae bacterium]